ncbi:hypothetical protein H8N03_15160 [Ramlibacter sp. USB13]|uniref:Uncharacterized protein n=1 Tax=Ramlibacter cellulosilyticus TaxID=2764187 RepID=A0A923MSC3_9BURK|nr:hypothetical protein [Ramlibacter cellulosilyticus]MBC5784290.1 hypothetical protein [Ramlibacter cellulosilyticus]
MRTTCLAAALAALPLLAAADAADPAAAVPPTTYRSVLPGQPAALAEPDLPWRQANDAVARFPRGHADIVKWENGQAAPAAPASAPRAPEAGRR